MDPFAAPLRTEGQLRELYGDAAERAWRKDVGRLDEIAAALIGAAPMVLVASHGPDGRTDVTPRGGPPGFVTVLDEHHLAIPDATGNKRLDTLRNVVATGRAGLLFLIPGRDQTLRVNGPACVTAAPDVLAALTPVGKAPVTAIVVRAEEVFTHCPKAFVRSRLWDPATWPAAADVPSPAEATLAHLRDPTRTLADEERYQAEALTHRLR